MLALIYLQNMNNRNIKKFADYKPDAHNWITLASGEYYPDILKDACELYKPANDGRTIDNGLVNL